MEILNPDKLNIDFVKKFKFFGIISIVVGVLSLISIFKPGFNYGIDFKGGVEAHLAFGQEQVTPQDIRDLLSEKTSNVTIVEIDSAANKEFFVTIQEDDADAFSKFLSQSLKAKYADKAQVLQLDSVGPKIGAELRKSALLSIIYTCILICIYMYWRFDMRYAPGALLSIFHDLVLTFGFLIATQMEFTTATVAALLTLAGYSINDTVVVFDRIREIEGKLLGSDRNTIVNRAINSTLSRTVMTSVTTLISCAVLYFVGGESLREFSATLFFGVVVGTYSSVFVAAPSYLLGDSWIKGQPKTKTA
ncbi:protein translocase subunit SecF [bacterium]|nr:protein translocase subunit SecF [bacterium]